MGFFRVMSLAVGAISLIFGVLVPIAVKLTCQVDQFKWVVPPGSISGKTVIVTGANSGLGFETARVLAKEGAVVVMACRSVAKCKAAMDDIRREDAKANLKAQLLDLSDPNSVRSFAAEFLASHDRLDLLINNAAIMATAYSSVRWPGGTVEKQFATNHLGPFLLTGLLQQVLEATSGARVVNHSSSASDFCKRVGDVHKIAHVSQAEYYAFSDVYACSKRANRYFTWSLNQRLKKVLSVACHPGWTGTNLQHRATGAKAPFMSDTLLEFLAAAANAAYSQTPKLGAQPQLYAATESPLEGGEVVGPRFFMIGTPVVETSEFCQLGSHPSAGRCSQGDLDTLWAESERLAGFIYNKV
eukprot:CAMPEP_0194284324 /NCGR_PEP_ID=MMETSP0169-20130528/27333_1 /TAXON_ID=218684 /ORGANISM="Corethron pennatum, Strain L29A3" /LENGTH=356 /DNA_ID=CAMNT_0039030109 /DNA_START=98 /DNA_END=1168 /DNA_ORIENTATION=-